MKEYRVTRPDLYLAIGCPGYADKRARQGHYFYANSEEEARLQACKVWPKDSRFTVDATGKEVDV